MNHALGPEGMMPAAPIYLSLEKVQAVSVRLIRPEYLLILKKFSFQNIQSLDYDNQSSFTQPFDILFDTDESHAEKKRIGTALDEKSRGSYS
jgi:hypothetical protein